MIQELAKYQALLTPQGREQIAVAMNAFRDAYGENWLAEFTSRNPDYATIIDLVANNDFPSAFVGLKQHVADRIGEEEAAWKRIGLTTTANLFMDGARNDLEILHGFLKAEIDKPRF